MPKKPKKPFTIEKASLAWLLTFSDLLMLLITFFVFLISMSSMDAKKLKDMFGFFQGAVASLESGTGYAHKKAGALIEREGFPAADVLTDTESPIPGDALELVKHVDYIVGLGEKQVEQLKAAYSDKEMGTRGMRPLDRKVKDLLAGAVPIEVIRHKKKMEIKLHMGLLFEEGKPELRSENKDLLDGLRRLAKMGAPLRRVEAPISEQGAETKFFSPWDLAAWRAGTLIRAVKTEKGIVATVTAAKEKRYVRIWMGLINP
ncbi:MAG: flagellar motor protein MotB [Pseudomonadota bacterium]